MSSLMKGTAILTIGLFLSKLLGLIYIFPFYAIVGEENIVLYNYAYIPYNIMLSIAIAGLPIAVSKFVSKYNALGDFDAGRRLVKTGALLMTLTGIIAFILMNLLATPLANIVIDSEDQTFSVEQVANVIKWVSYALIVVPFMSLVRGYLQGYGHYLPTSVSQLVEQIVRIVFLLGGAFIVVNVMDGDEITAINFSVFAAFIGALGGLVTLFYFWKKLRPDIKAVQVVAPKERRLPYSDMYKEIFKYSIPVVFVGLGSSLFQLVDLLTFIRAMNASGISGDISEAYFTMLNLLTQKIVMIPVVLATGFSMAIIPTVTKFYTEGNLRQVHNAMDKTYQVLLFITVPAAIGISILAEDLYHFFYSFSEMGTQVLSHYAPVAILFALFTVTAAILQGVNYQKWVIFSLLVGLFVKTVLNTPLIHLMSVDGAILATALGYSVTIIINIFVINKVTNYNAKVVVRRILLIIILTILMALAVSLTHAALSAIAPATSKLLALLYAVVCATVGVFVYGTISYKLGLAQLLLGDKLTKLARKLRLVK
ncbi:MULTISPECIES: putative polysaccharide biosynthesis protein [Solibacillus]|uniref:Polysaccharide biosynthesis protein n=1 Tax=Solibacillus merdavium TaxID=2762218 RepID=A0ABR8XS37_9BACL|nr:polysaccharide biosynthesis protein [Solibacillus merdavium]MBD8034712.1 polysaccharide biosynthesis protein [Solibacillus merdavium]